MGLFNRNKKRTNDELKKRLSELEPSSMDPSPSAMCYCRVVILSEEEKEKRKKKLTKNNPFGNVSQEPELDEDLFTFGLPSSKKEPSQEKKDANESPFVKAFDDAILDNETTCAKPKSTNDQAKEQVNDKTE